MAGRNELALPWNSGFVAESVPVNFSAMTPASAQGLDYRSVIGAGQQGAIGAGGFATDARAQQASLADAILARARGEGGPSLAELQLRQATDRNAAQAAGAIGSIRGMNPGAAARLILNQQAGMNQQAAGQAALLRAQEQQSAQALGAQALGGMRGQDLGQMGAYGALFGQAGGLQQGLTGADLERQRMNAQMALAQQQSQMEAQRINAGIDQQNAQNNAQVIGSTVNAIGAGLGMGAGGKFDGGEIPGRPAVAGDSPRNDTVPAWLSPGEIVLPRTVAQSANAPDRAAEFVAAIRGGEGGGGPEGLAELDRRLREIEARLSGSGGGKAGGR